MDPEVVVIGAGISGLSCLWRLVHSGVDALGLEASNRAGGVIRSLHADGFLVETGPNTVLSTPELLRLIEEAGLGEELVRSDPGLDRFVYRHGGLHAVPRSLPAMLRSRMISGRGKLRIAAEIAVPARRDGAEESVEAFVARRFGTEAVDALVAPFVSGTFAGDASRLSAAAVFPSLVGLERRFGGVLRGFLRGGGKRGERPELISLRQGLEALTARLAERMGARIRYGQAVERIEREASGPARFRIYAGGRETAISARAVVLAVPAWAAAAVLTPISEPASAALAELAAPALASVTLAWPRERVSRPLGGFGFLVGRGEAVHLLGCLWNTSIFPARAPRGWVSLTSFVGGACDPAAAGIDDETLVARVGADLARILGADGAPRVLSLVRYERSIPQYTYGHPQRAERIRAAVAAVPGLFLAGNFLDGISVGDCVRHGLDAATAVGRTLASGVDFPARSV